MKKCCVCGNDCDSQEAPILFIGQNDDYKEICDKCAMHMDTIAENVDNQNVRKAVGYFEGNLNFIEDLEVKEFLKDMILKKKKTFNTNNTIQNYTVAENDSIWIKGLKFIAWMVFISIIITGMILGVAIGDGIGFLIFILSFPVAFLVVAVFMVCLDNASDIRCIKNSICK